MLINNIEEMIIQNVVVGIPEDGDKISKLIVITLRLLFDHGKTYTTGVIFSKKQQKCFKKWLRVCVANLRSLSLFVWSR